MNAQYCSVSSAVEGTTGHAGCLVSTVPTAGD